MSQENVEIVRRVSDAYRPPRRGSASCSTNSTQRIEWAPLVADSDRRGSHLTYPDVSHVGVRRRGGCADEEVLRGAPEVRAQSELDFEDDEEEDEVVRHWSPTSSSRTWSPSSRTWSTRRTPSRSQLRPPAPSSCRNRCCEKPEPLKCTATGWKTRCTVAPQMVHSVIGSSVMRCMILEGVALLCSGIRRWAWHSEYMSARRALRRTEAASGARGRPAARRGSRARRPRLQMRDGTKGSSDHRLERTPQTAPNGHIVFT